MFLCIKLYKIYNIVTIKWCKNMNIKQDKKRFVLLVDNDVYEKFKILAKDQNRTAGNLGTKLIIDYVKENYNT